jgi:TRAP-type C4-dicarboxylate transport system permease large subunit
LTARLGGSYRAGWLVKPLVPFLIAIVAVLVLVAFIPERVLLVSRLLGFVK